MKILLRPVQRAAHHIWSAWLEGRLYPVLPEECWPAYMPEIA